MEVSKFSHRNIQNQFLLPTNPVDTRRRFNVYKTLPTSHRRLTDVETTSCVYWEKGSLRNIGSWVNFQGFMVCIQSSNCKTLKNRYILLIKLTFGKSILQVVNFQKVPVLSILLSVQSLIKLTLINTLFKKCLNWAVATNKYTHHMSGKFFESLFEFRYQTNLFEVQGKMRKG